MAAFNFQSQFAARVRLGILHPDHPLAKRQTIRAPRKDGRDPVPGDTAHLFTGMRTPFCLRLGEAVILRRRDIAIVSGLVSLDGRILKPADQGALARADGFAHGSDFTSFFMERHGLPFHGFLYLW